MDVLLKEQEKLEKNVNLGKSIDDIDAIIAQLEAARESIAESMCFDPAKPTFNPRSDPTSAPVTLAKLQQPIKTSFEAVNTDMKEVYKGHARYQKALDNVSPPSLLPPVKPS